MDDRKLQNEREFAENLIDDLRIAEEVAKRDAADTGERLTLEELESEFQNDRKGLM